MSGVNEKTAISVSVVVIICGAIFWAATVASRVGTTEAGVTELKEEKNLILSKLEKHGEALARIEGSLEEIKKGN